LLEIPDDINRLRRESPKLAERWRLAVNQAFRASFAERYAAVSFVRDESSGARRLFYVLERS
jgi:predicted GNAT superfamily acetyltransferase